MVNTVNASYTEPTELKDTIDLMTSDNYKDRFIAEYFQLKIRITKLRRTVENYSDMFTCPKSLLVSQLIAMQGYMSYLLDRMKLEYTDDELAKYKVNLSDVES